jgi:hypothetical protein
VVNLAFFRGVSASACVTYIGYFFATGGDVVSVDCVAFVAAAGFRKQFARNAALASNV